MNFHKLAMRISQLLGSPFAFFGACLLTILWLVLGYQFSFSTKWIIVGEAFASISTFLLAFIIQHTQSRNEEETRLQLNEIIKGIKGANNSLIEIERLTDEELETLHHEYTKLHTRATKEMLKRGKKPSHFPIPHTLVNLDTLKNIFS